MKKGWKEIYFKDFIKLNRGFDLPNERIEDGDYPVVASTSIKAYHKNYKVLAPCVTTGRSGSLGTVQYVNYNSWPLNTTLYVKDFKNNNPKFVYYFLQTMNLEIFNSGTGVPTLNQNHLHFLKINIPKSTKHQQYIASILSAYDDLIEVNNKRIDLLEQSARELYKEWFIRMRFPNYQNTKFKKGIPEGWKVDKIENVFDILGGGTPSTENNEYWNGNINWYSPTDLTGTKSVFFIDSSKKITKFGLQKSSAKLFEPYCIMMTSRATIGVLGINTTPACTNQGFITCIPNEKVPLFYLYYFLKQNKDYIETFATGSTFLEITKGTFKKLDILIPKEQIAKKFNKIVSPIFNQIENLQKQSQQLIDIRNRLLPRLISGKLEIKV